MRKYGNHLNMMIHRNEDRLGEDLVKRLMEAFAERGVMTEALTVFLDYDIDYDVDKLILELATDDWTVTWLEGDPAALRQVWDSDQYLDFIVSEMLNLFNNPPILDNIILGEN